MSLLTPNSIRAAAATAALLTTCIVVSPAEAAVTYSLASDFSNASNPNGVWSFTQGVTLLTHFPQPTVANPLNAAAASGYWGVGNDFNSNAVPFVLKTTQDGSATSPYTNNDFLTGDVIAHSPNSGSPLFINWTSPAAGTISFSSAVWYAHSPVIRSNDISDILGGNVLGTVTVNDTITRPNAITTLSGSNLTVTAGEVLSFEFVRTAGQQYGSLSGISETIDFTPSGVPEPATWAIMLSGFGLMGAKLRSRRQRSPRSALVGPISRR